MSPRFTRLSPNCVKATSSSMRTPRGFRTFEARDGKFFLNGQPFYMRGALDQDYYPEGIYTPPSLEFLEDQARKSKELGLNLASLPYQGSRSALL